MCYTESMKKHASKTVNQTFSLPHDVCAELQTFVRTRERSRFVAEAIKIKLQAKKEELRKAYLSANEDEGQLEAIEEWEDTLGDGSIEW